MSERPDWFLGFLEEAIQMTSVSDEFVESALGIGCMIDAGNQTDARRLYDEAAKALRTMRITQTPGEQGSTQVRTMIQSLLYPLDLRMELSRRLKIPLG